MSSERSIGRAFEAQRGTTRRKRSSPDDQVRRRLVIRRSGESQWQPPIKHSVEPAVPSEVWVRLWEPGDPPSFSASCVSLQAGVGSYLKASKPDWVDQPIDWYFLSFSPASINREFFDLLAGVSEIGGSWRTHLLTDGRNIASTAVIDQLLASCLHQVHVYVTALGESTVSTKVLGAVKDLVDLRVARRQNNPEVICRLCPHSACGPKLIAEITQWSRQAGVDRLEVTDKQTEEKRLWG